MGSDKFLYFNFGKKYVNNAYGALKKTSEFSFFLEQILHDYVVVKQKWEK